MSDHRILIHATFLFAGQSNGSARVTIAHNGTDVLAAVKVRVTRRCEVAIATDLNHDILVGVFM